VTLRFADVESLDAASRILDSAGARDDQALTLQVGAADLDDVFFAVTGDKR
jgi:hypothetical protein